MRKSSVILFLVIMIITACSRQQKASPPVTLPSTTLQPPLFKTKSSAQTTTITPTPSMAPSKTLTASETPHPNPINKLVSPDRNYVAKLYSDLDHPSGKETIEIWDAKTGSLLWTIPYQGEMPRGDPRPHLTINQCSPDSSILYFYYSFAYDGWWTLFDGNALQAINVKTGLITAIAPECCLAFSFSPDMNTLVFLSGKDITLLDVSTEIESTVQIQAGDFLQAGYIHWSPSGDKFVFSVLVDENGNTLMILFDKNTMQQKIIVDYFLEDFPFDGWTSNEDLRYKVNGVVFAFDTKTGKEIIIGTPTPQP